MPHFQFYNAAADALSTFFVLMLVLVPYSLGLFTHPVLAFTSVSSMVTEAGPDRVPMSASLAILFLYSTVIACFFEFVLGGFIRGGTPLGLLCLVFSLLVSPQLAQWATKRN